MVYDYKDAKERIDKILSSDTKIENREKIPKSDDEFTYENGITTWVGAIFVDMVDSSEMCKAADDKTARLFRAFCSEIITIMKLDKNFRQIGIRGDCVYSINTAPKRSDLVKIYDTAIRINTFMIMFNKELERYGYEPIKAGIGLGCGEDLVIKAGKSHSAINDKICIGDSVVQASKLPDMANRNGEKSILMTNIFYSNVIEILERRNKDYRDWFKRDDYIDKYGHYYGCNLIKKNFNNWINNDYKL